MKTDKLSKTFKKKRVVLWLVLVILFGFFTFLSTPQEKCLPVDGMPYYFQADEKYQNTWYGDGLLSQTGCGPTSLAMALSFLTNQALSPVEIADYSQQNGYYVNGVGTAWALFEDYSALYGVDVWQCILDKTLIAQELAQDHVVILSMGPGDFTSGGHIMVIKNLVNTNQTNVHDPNSKAKSKTWDLVTVLSQAKAAFVLTLK